MKDTSICLLSVIHLTTPLSTRSLISHFMGGWRNEANRFPNLLSFSGEPSGKGTSYGKRTGLRSQPFRFKS